MDARADASPRRRGKSNKGGVTAPIIEVQATVRSCVRIEAEMAMNRQLDGTIQPPDGLLLRAVEAFGSTDKALNWLDSPHYELGGRTPREVVSSDGPDQVLGIMVALEYGLPA
jgi:hypothetical protein